MSQDAGQSPLDSMPVVSLACAAFRAACSEHATSVTEWQYDPKRALSSVKQ